MSSAPLVIGGSVHDQGKAVVPGVIDDQRRHLLQNTLRNFILLRAGIVLGVLRVALQRFLLGLNLLHQVGFGVVIQFVTLGVELLLHAVDLVALGLELILLGLKLLA